MTTKTTITGNDGREWPVFEGNVLSWDIGAHATPRDENEGWPRTRVVIRAMIQHRPHQIAKERTDYIRGSCDRVFGHNARKLLKVIDEELLRELQRVDTVPRDVALKAAEEVLVAMCECGHAIADHNHDGPTTWCVRCQCQRWNPDHTPVTLEQQPFYPCADCHADTGDVHRSFCDACIGKRARAVPDPVIEAFEEVLSAARAHAEILSCDDDQDSTAEAESIFDAIETIIAWQQDKSDENVVVDAIFEEAPCTSSPSGAASA